MKRPCSSELEAGDLEETGYQVDSANVSLVIELHAQLDSKHPVTLISPLGLTFLADAQAAPSAGTSLSLSLILASGRFGPIAARVESVLPGQQGISISVQFVDPPSAMVREILAWIQALIASGAISGSPTTRPIVETIEDRGRILEISRSLVAHACSGWICTAGAKPSDRMQAHVARVEPDSEWPIQLWVDTPWPPPPLILELIGFNSVYRLPVADYRPDVDFFAIGVPPRIERYRHRMTRRVSVPSGTVSFRHPQLPDLHIARRARDVSIRGFAFHTTPTQDLVFPGLRMPEVQIAIGPHRLTIPAVVRHVSTDARGEGYVCGLELGAVSPFDVDPKWLFMIDAMLHPTTLRGVHSVEALWSLYDKSGYFNLSGKAPADFDGLRESFAMATSRYNKAPNLACQVMWYSPQRLEASASSSKMYSGTWLFFQLARQKGRPPIGVPGRQMVREIYIHAFEHAQYDPKDRFMLSYIEANVRWHGLTHLAFAKQRSTGDYPVLAPEFRLMEAIDLELDLPNLGGCSFGESTDEETEILLDHLQRTYPPTILEALDLAPSSYDLSDVNAALEETGFSRERSLIVARRGETAVAAALCETGTDGMHLFRLHDGVRLFSFEPVEEEVHLHLIDRAVRWYAERGKNAFVFYIDEPHRSVADRAGLVDLGKGHIWLVHTSLIQDFLEHIWTVTAPREVPTPTDEWAVVTPIKSS